MPPPTIHRVADLAGVSVATVSRALKQPDKVHPTTRARVIEAVEAIGFVPNGQARTFRRQASETVILLVRDIGNPFYLEIYKGVEEAAFEAGYRVLMGDARMDDTRIHHYLGVVRERHADGLILMTGRLPEPLRRRPAALPPMVVALEYLADFDLPTIRIDNAGAAEAAVAHLIGLGHRAIAHVTGPMPERMSIDRDAGYRAALAAAGIRRDPALTVLGDYSLAAGRTAVAGLLDNGTPFTAVFASNDEMAMGAISELRARGRRVPEDVSVVGFDDIVFAEAAGLTTIHQPRREIGRGAMKLLIAELRGEPRPDAPLIVPSPLVVRASTAAVPTL